MGKNKTLMHTENVVTYRKLLKYELSWKRVHRMQSCRIRNGVNSIILNIQTLGEAAVNRKKKVCQTFEHWHVLSKTSP
jgi:hypothetical protein